MMAIKRVYDINEDPEEIMLYLKQTSSKPIENKVSFKQGVFG